MLQRVSFKVADREIEGVLHLPDTETIGGATVLHGFGGHPDQPHVIATSVALATAGVAALRFAFRDHQPPTMTFETALADTAAAIRLLRAHPQVPERVGVVGFSFGGAVAALAAGRDSRMRAAVLAAAPASFGKDPKWKPLAELSRTRARVLLIWGSRDTQVPFEHAERYATVLSQAHVKHQIVVVEGGDHDFSPTGPRAKMAAVVATWLRDHLS